MISRLANFTSGSASIASTRWENRRAEPAIAPYRSGRTVSAAMEELRSHAGTQFCPTVIEAMEAIYREQPQLLGAAALRAVGDAAA